MVRRSENSIWLVASRRPRLRSAASIDAHLLGRVVRDADGPHQSLGVRRGERVGQRVVRAQRDRPVDLVQVDGRRQPRRSSECRAAESSALCTFSFQGLGMNFVAMTTRARTPGSAASSRPMMRSLSPWP